MNNQLSITNKILDENLNNYLNEEFITNYSTPGTIN